MLIALLIGLFVLNIPVFLLLAWIVFDTKANTAESLTETMLYLFREMLTPRWMRMLSEDDSPDGSTLFHSIMFFGACIAVYAGELYLINLWLPLENL